MPQMQLPEGVEWSIHCCWLLALLPGDTALSARRLAEFYGLPDAYLSKLLKSLVRAGLLTASSGPRGGFRLARPPAEMTVLDIVGAVEGTAPAFRCMEIRQRGPAPLARAECRHPCGIASVMHDAERAWRESLAGTTVADLVRDAGNGSVTRARRWLGSLPATSPA
jgi:Rrf2 family protein